MMAFAAHHSDRINSLWTRDVCPGAAATAAGGYLSGSDP